EFRKARIGRSLSRNRPLRHYQFVILPRGVGYGLGKQCLVSGVGCRGGLVRLWRRITNSNRLGAGYIETLRLRSVIWHYVRWRRGPRTPWRGSRLARYAIGILARHRIAGISVIQIELGIAGRRGARDRGNIVNLLKGGPNPLRT